jgi:uncharacterized alpha-E superfamily protein
MRCALARLLAENRYEKSPALKAVVRLLTRLDLLPRSFADGYSVASLEAEVLASIHQVHRLGAIRDIIGRLRRIALVVRDRFSGDTWRIFNKLQSEPQIPPRLSRLNHAMHLLNTLVFDLAAFSGLQMENMTREAGWHFLDLGRRLERAINMVTLSEAVMHPDAAGPLSAELMLEIADSVMTYRRRYFAAPQMAPVLGLLWLDGTNPRSLAHQLDAIAGHIRGLPDRFELDGPLPGADALAADRVMLRSWNLETLAASDALNAEGTITQSISGIARDLRQFSDILTQRYFSHSQNGCASR